MRVYITKAQTEYFIIKVADRDIQQFELENNDLIIVKGKDIAEAIRLFDQVTKDSSLTFNSELKKYRSTTLLDDSKKSKFRLM